MEDKYKNMAKVVRQLDDYKFVINHGEEQGVESGDNYLIFGIGDQIVDPDTGEELGLLEVVKGRARVVHVQERLATLESSLKIVSPGRKKIITREGGIAGVSAFMRGPSVEQIEEGSESHTAKIDVEIGDIARPV